MSSSKTRARNVASFTELYEKLVGPDTLVSAVITGHLAVEFLLRKLVSQYDQKLAPLAGDLSHARLIELCRDIGRVSSDQAIVLLEVNQLRNKLAHRIAFVPTVSELKALYAKAAAAFSDSTDGIAQGLHELEGANSTGELENWVFLELFIQIAYDLHSEYVAAGGHEEDF